MEKKLYRIREGKMVCGVCGGIAKYFGIDVSLVRLGVVLLSCAGSGVIAYIAAAIIVPEEPYSIES